MSFSQENRFLLFYYFGKLLFSTCSYATKTRIADPTAPKIGFFVTLFNGSKPFTDITKNLILDVAGSVCYFIFYRIVLFYYLEPGNTRPYSQLHGNWACYFINCQNYRREMLYKKK